MKKILFLVTELQRPVGGLYRFTVELLPAWRKNVLAGKAEFEPVVFSIRDPAIPLGDLTEVNTSPISDIAKKLQIKIYSAKRGGEVCFFVESSLNLEQRNAFHKTLYDKYRIKSEKAASWPFYQTLNAFWYYMPLVADELIKAGYDIAAIDAQDWLAFPAGFLTKQQIKRALNCRFHSGEFGRSVGFPDFLAPPVLIERASLQEADYIQGVSIDEAKFEIYNLLQAKIELSRELESEKSAKWKQEQDWKTENYEEYLLLEPTELALITQSVAGITNGIILDDWMKINSSDIAEGKAMLQKLMPNRKKYITFIGRADYRKGIDALVEAFGKLSNKDCGLLISSVLSADDYQRLFTMASSLGVSENVLLYNGWLEEKIKKQIFCASDVICLPSLYEPFGLVTLEGLAADLACEKNNSRGPVVVVGDTGGMHEVIKNGVNGFKSPMEQEKFSLPPTYLSKILKLVLKDEELSDRISKGGAQRVKSQYFDWEFINTLFMQIYRKAIENYTKWN